MPGRDELEAALAGLEAQRATLGDAVVNPAIAALRQQLAQLDDASSQTKPGSSLPVTALEERKVVTILFVDVSGFTALAEKLDPEEVRSLINACFDCLVPIVQKYDGTIDKFIGDEIMALFGAPQAHENDPERALRSALEMMDRMSSFNQEHGTELSLHIGVNTGPVVTGAIGSRNRKDYSVMGDAVNLAARLEDASADGEIFVGPSTYRRTSALFEFAALPPLTLKGKSEPLAIHRLTGLKAQPQPVRGIAGMRSELVGRRRELETILDAFTRLKDGTGGIVSIVGEAGVGKSRLVSEALTAVNGNLFWAEGRGLSHTTGMSYWMGGSLLRSLLRQNDSATAAEIGEALSKDLQSALPNRFRDVYPYLATLLHIPLDDETSERVKYLSSEALHGQILNAASNYIRARARQQPLILFWEDLHWCDPSSLLLLESFVGLTKQAGVLLMLAYRPDEDAIEALEQQVQKIDGFQRIRLAPLTREQSGSLIDHLLNIENLPDEICDLILDRAEGNPFFIEELLRSLLDSGAVKLENGRVRATAAMDKSLVPETVEGVLTARMDRLSPDQKVSLQSAAVIGRNFEAKVLKKIVPDHVGSHLPQHLGELRRRDFVQPASNHESANGEHMFRHAITQDVAYNALLKARRREIHRGVGEVIEHNFADRLEEVSSTLAYHFEKADARDKALHYLHIAGDRAKSLFANTEAETFFRKAIAQGIAILEQTRDAATVQLVAQVHESLGDVLSLAGKNDEARQSYDAALALLPNDEHVRRACLRRKIGLSYTLQHRYDAMTQAFDDADVELGATGSVASDEWWSEKIQVLLERMHLLYWQGLSDEMRALADRHQEAVKERGTPLQRGRFFQMLGLSHLTGARYLGSDEAVRLTELAVSTSRESPDLAAMSHVRFTAGLTNIFRGNLAPAVEHFRGAFSLAERVGDLVVQARSLTYLTVAFRRLGDREQTRIHAEHTIALATQLGMVEYVAMAKANLAWLAWRESDTAEARSLGEEALRLWHGMEDPYGVDWQALLPLIAVSVSEQRFADAVAHTKGLFGENQHPLPDSLVKAANEVIGAAERKDSDALPSKFAELISVSQQIGYL